MWQNFMEHIPENEEETSKNRREGNRESSKIQLMSNKG